MRREKSIIIMGIIGGLIIGLVVGYAWAYNAATRKPLPSETELPDQTILFNQKDLKEVKAFLSKYPEANIWVERSGNMEVYYSVSNLSKYPIAMYRYDNTTGKMAIIANNGTTIGQYDNSTGKFMIFDSAGTITVEQRSLQLAVSVDEEGKPQGMRIHCSGKPLKYDNILDYIETETCLKS